MFGVRQVARFYALAAPTLFALNVFCAEAITQRVTLYPPQDAVTATYDEGRACLSFRYGMVKQFTREEWDLGYGLLRIDEQDWFRVNSSHGSRSVMKDLGELKWDDAISPPRLEPLPELPKGERREIGVDASADTHAQWAKTTQIFAKAELGHMYLVHVKDEMADFYVMFRVEDLEQNNHCTISWRLVPTPESARSPN